jgi:hypothetical protein
MLVVEYKTRRIERIPSVFTCSLLGRSPPPVCHERGGGSLFPAESVEEMCSPSVQLLGRDYKVQKVILLQKAQILYINDILLWQNVADQCCHFLDGFSQLWMVLEKNSKYVQNYLEISVLNMFLKILHNGRS